MVTINHEWNGWRHIHEHNCLPVHAQPRFGESSEEVEVRKKLCRERRSEKVGRTRRERTEIPSGSQSVPGVLGSHLQKTIAKLIALTRRKPLQKTNVFCISSPKPRQTNAFRKMDRIFTENVGKQRKSPTMWVDNLPQNQKCPTLSIENHYKTMSF